MRFYKFSGHVMNKDWEKIISSKTKKDNLTKDIFRESEFFNMDYAGKAQFFVSDLNYKFGEDFLGGVLDNDFLDVESLIPEYLKAIGISLDGIKVEEQTLSSFKTLLSAAERNDLLFDDDKVLESFGLDGLGRVWRGVPWYSENLIGKLDKSAVFNQAKRYLADGTLLPELQRIYGGKAPKKLLGHPVHYFVLTDDRDTRKEIYRLLLNALYMNHRLHSLRYCYLDQRAEDGFAPTFYDSLYKSMAGGTVVVRIDAADSAENDEASAGRFLMEKLAETARRYRNEVLTILCFPRESTRYKSWFRENAGSMTMVEIQEDFADKKRAKEFLSFLAREHGVKGDKKLYESLEEDHGYLAPELNNIFDEWYDNKLKTGIYPQYKGLASARAEAAKEAPRGTAYDELQKLCGLDSAKKVIRQALDYYKAQKLFAERGMQEDHPAMHMIFTGNPGTAKTTAARLFARIMQENGLLSRGQMVEVGRGDLVGKYVGWTAVNVQKKFKEAEGGVLFIDEAYSLVDDRSGSFGDEAINTIVQEMENHRDDMVVIFAGYPDRMEGFLEKNPGLRSRIAFHVPFSDYESDELLQIAEIIAGEKGFCLSDGAKDRLAGVFETARLDADFGNGRFVRNLLEKARMAQASRLLQMDLDTVTDKDIRTIEASDIEAPEAKKPVKQRLGFSVA